MRGSYHGGLLEYYRRELRYLRDVGAGFARKYPKIASRLQMGKDESPDPHVERLIESFAFLTGRLQHGIDSEFPEIPTALLNLLYPHLLDPVPSLGIARFDPDPTQGELTSGYTLARHMPLFTDTEEGDTCRFRTAYDLTLWPIEIEDAVLESAHAYDFLDNTDIPSVLRIRLSAAGQSTLSELDVDELRFHITGELAMAGAIYENLFANLAGIVLVADDKKDHPNHISDDSIQPVGFEPEHALLPHPGHAHPAYRLVQEYFAFPEKFLFFDIKGLVGHGAEQTLDILFLLKQPPREALFINEETFVLGCTPVINLFPRTSEPIRVTETDTRYRLIPDMRFERTTEIHSILKVSGSADVREEAQEYAPFFSFRHASMVNEYKNYWYATREETERADLGGTHMHLSFVDLDFNPQAPAGRTVFAHTLCTNRGLADQIPPDAALSIEDAGPIAAITVIRKPTPQMYAPLGGPSLWRLISHLSVNYLSLNGDDESLEALRQILKLYAISSRPATEQQILGLRKLKARPIVRRIQKDQWRGFVKGTELTLELDERFFVGSSAFLMATVLNRFFGLYGSINSFTQLAIENSQFEGPWKQWPPVAGAQIVL
ncbi:MAG: type VI secretion system baseplate subunit TssF [Magnetovibrionaceae bacterium]